VSYPQQETRQVAPMGSGPLWSTVAQTAFATGLAAFVMGLLAASVANSTGNETAGFLVRGLLAMVMVLLICRSLARTARRKGLSQPALAVLVGAALGFLIDPLTWAARTALTQVVANPGVVTLLGDLLLWLLVAAAGAQWGAREGSGPAPATTPYG
jgi:hypothetical protein